jgi:hypothetical protein
VWIDLFQFLQQFDARHAIHHDIQDRDVDALGAGDLDRVRPVARDADVEVVLENDLQRLAGPLLVINDQEGGSGGDWGNRG